VAEGDVGTAVILGFPAGGFRQGFSGKDFPASVLPSAHTN